MGRKLLTILGPLFGFLFLTAYVRSAAADVVYTDYIRLVNSYLGNVFSFRPYLHGDILTRIPANYPERIVNVVLFHYSTMFDMFLGAFFLAASSFTAMRYCRAKQVPYSVSVLVLFLLFSLNKWEMLTNGSGWVHFAAFALFFEHYLLFDRVMSGEGRPGDGKKLLLFPWVTILCFGGPYGGVYAVTLLLADGFIILVMKGDRREALRRMANTFLPLLLYLFSRAVSVEERAGATAEPLSAVIQKQPLLLPRLFIRSFSSMVIGGETQEWLGMGRGLSLFLGGIVLLFYVWAFLLNFWGRLYEKTLFPLFLLTSGFLNHVLITASRWIFLSDAYGMSSRYALQYQVGIAGILLTFVLSEKKGGRKAALAFCSAIIFLGTVITTGREIHMAPYRKEHFVRMQETALNFETESDETLREVLLYHDPVRTRAALTLLREQNLNIFYEKGGAEAVPAGQD